MDNLGHVFISYSKEDSNIADAIVNDFEQHGIKCWYAPRDIIPGESFTGTITEAIKSCWCFVLVYTEASNNSEWVLNEVIRAFEEQRKIIPFCLTEMEMNDDLKYILARVHRIQALTPPLNQKISNLRDVLLTIRPMSVENNFSPQTSPILLDSSIEARLSSADDLHNNTIPGKITDVENNASISSKYPQNNIVWRGFALLLILALLIVASVICIQYFKTQAVESQIASDIGLESNQLKSAGNEESKITNDEMNKAAEDANHEFAQSIPPEIFWGTFTCIESSSNGLRDYIFTYQAANGIELELIAFPQSMTVSKENPNQMMLTFLDKYGVSFDFVSDYTVENETLCLSEPNQNTQKEVPPYKLTNKLQFALSINYSNITLSYDDQYRVYNNLGRGSDTLTLQGSACSENDIYYGIRSVDIDLQDGSKSTACQLFFDDLEYTTDAVAYWNNNLHEATQDQNSNIYDSTVTVTFRERMIRYNGRWQKDPVWAGYTLRYINTYPYGFILYDSNRYYRYQNGVTKIVTSSRGGSLTTESSESTIN